VAYPRLGIDTFIASDDFVNPHKRRGFISDDAMVDRVIEEYEKQKESGPVFIHAVTMQNHTTYSRDRYPEDELVKVTASPAAIPDSTIGQLEDCATGIREMDAALGKLADYLKTTGRPTILVFWGDHLNPMSDGYALFEDTGLIAEGDTAAPELYQVPLLIWSNYADNKVDLGTLAIHNIAPVLMDLYGMEQPGMFEFLMQQLPAMRGRSHGITVEADDTFSETMDEVQQGWFNDYAILQYDYLFGEQLLEDYTE
jgi:phosphoglycerol transferase MdoB-like AlkP superfamily enzyme